MYRYNHQFTIALEIVYRYNVTNYGYISALTIVLLSTQYCLAINLYINTPLLLSNSGFMNKAIDLLLLIINFSAFARLGGLVRVFIYALYRL